jgi:hypothetical protein
MDQAVSHPLRGSLKGITLQRRRSSRLKLIKEAIERRRRFSCLSEVSRGHVNQETAPMSSGGGTGRRGDLD